MDSAYSAWSTIIRGIFGHYDKSLVSVFQEFFASINKILILAGGLGAGLLFYGGLGHFLISPNFLGF